MGYNLYITRRDKTLMPTKDSEIALEEWNRWVESDPELRFDESLGEHTAFWSGRSDLEIPWLQWGDGCIETKNPDDALIAKMVSIAEALGASVRGEGGERYGGPFEPEPIERPTILQRLRSWWQSRASSPAELEVSDLPFRVGDRVRDVFGDRNPATITKIDLNADHGMGRITVRYDDGRIGHHVAISHGLESSKED